MTKNSALKHETVVFLQVSTHGKGFGRHLSWGRGTSKSRKFSETKERKKHIFWFSWWSRATLNLNTTAELLTISHFGQRRTMPFEPISMADFFYFHFFCCCSSSLYPRVPAMVTETFTSYSSVLTTQGSPRNSFFFLFLFLPWWM